MKNENTLSVYGIKTGATIVVAMRLLGGSLCGAMLQQTVNPSLPRSDEACMITHENFKKDGVVVLQMPCNAKHAICPDALMTYAWSEISTNKKTEVKCPLCDVEWPFDVIKRYGGATTTELDQLQLGMSHNYCAKSNNINQCPKCGSYCMRVQTNVNSVRCFTCSKKSNSNIYFCWFCLQDWKSSLSSSSCGNANCNDAEKLTQLQSCGKVKVLYTDIETFKLRACPKCGIVIEHAGGCKKMTCETCKTKFCFVCLRMMSQGSWPCGSFDTKCAAAPVQTSIPRP